MTQESSPHDASLAARILGLGGLVPFTVPALFSWLAPDFAGVDWRALLADYGAVILSFVGALHWGYAIHPRAAGQSAWLLCGWSVLPALLAVAALQCPLPLGLRLLAGGLCCVVLVDHGLLRVVALPAWFLRLRYQLTIVASASLLAGSFA